MERVDRGIIGEWRELGFHYRKDNQSQEWQLTGSRAGLMNFVRLLREYAAHPGNDRLGEHDHYGPYSYLEIMTWSEAGFDDHSIHGSLADLAQLAELVEQAIESSSPGQIARIQDEYSPSSPYSLVLDVREDDFDPASADPNLPAHLL